ncbi:MAG: hypothetical protein AAFQ89_24630 [Cyanobacteria bacterium J06626_18]
MVFGFQILQSSPIQAQSVTQATVTEILDGNQVYIQDLQAQVSSVARQQEQVRTGTSRTALSFNTGAVARLAQNSSLTVGQCAQLQQGTVLVNGSLDGCTGSTLAGVRGTTYTFTVDENGVETLQVFEGTVDVSRIVSVRGLWGPRLQAGTDGESLELTEEPVSLREGQSLTYNSATGRASIMQLTQTDFEQLLQGPLVAEFAEELPGLDDLRDAFERLFPDAPFPELSL